MKYFADIVILKIPARGIRESGVLMTVYHSLRGAVNNPLLQAY